MMIVTAWEPPPVQYFQAIAALVPLLLFTLVFQSKAFDAERDREIAKSVDEARSKLKQAIDEGRPVAPEHADPDRWAEAGHRMLRRGRVGTLISAICAYVVAAFGIVSALAGIAAPTEVITGVATQSAGTLLFFVLLVETLRLDLGTRTTIALSVLMGGVGLALVIVLAEYVLP